MTPFHPAFDCPGQTCLGGIIEYWTHGINQVYRKIRVIKACWMIWYTNSAATKVHCLCLDFSMSATGEYILIIEMSMSNYAVDGGFVEEIKTRRMIEDYQFGSQGPSKHQSFCIYYHLPIYLLQKRCIWNHKLFTKMKPRPIVTEPNGQISMLVSHQLLEANTAHGHP